MAIKKISQDVVDKIEKKTAKSLPDQPSKLGYSPDQIKKRLYRALTDEEDSLVSEINRIVDEVNQALTEMNQTIVLKTLIMFDTVEEANAANLPENTFALIKN